MPLPLPAPARPAGRSATPSASSPRALHRTLSRTLPLALSLALAIACGSAERSTGPSAAPTAMRLGAGAGQNGSAGATLPTPLSVVVTDAGGKVLSGVRVEWDAGAGSGTLEPAASVSDARGVATTTWTLGAVAGTGRVTAQVGGLNPVVFTATIVPAAPSVVVATPALAFLGLGDTLRVRAAVRDKFGNDVAGETPAFTTLDPAVATISGEGLVTAIGLGAARLVASRGTLADTVPVTVSAAGSSVCGTFAPRPLALGEVFIPAAGSSGLAACIGSTAASTTEYAIALINTAPEFGSVTSLNLHALGNAGPTTAALTGGLSDLGGLGGLAGLAAEVAPVTPIAAMPVTPPPAQAELARREIERRELTGLAEPAREWERTRMPSLVAAPKVGDIVRLNANGLQACSRADTRVGRVAAIGTRGIVVSDTANPAGGYTDAEYASIVATFDTLIYPIDTEAFGAPSNIGAQGKVVLFYTRNVNALTPRDANYTIGGFFFARDLYPRTARNRLPGCEGSNEQEMMYMLVPDPNGTVNGNRRTKAEITLLNLGTLAHELQHLINASRRLYVTPNAATNEESWLDEGLSHVAEEMLYLRMAGYTSRQNLTLQDVQRQSGNFTNYASQNFSRFYNFLINPEGNSPYAPNDSLATRGAIWSFLRFVAGRQGASGEAPFFRTLVNSPTTGFANLSNAMGGQMADYLRDWAVSNIADDFGAATTAALDPMYQSLGWNFRSVYPGLRIGGATLGVYPIGARSLRSNAAQRIALAGGTSSYVRFSLAGGRDMLLTLSANGAALPSSMRYAIVRLR